MRVKHTSALTSISIFTFKRISENGSEKESSEKTHQQETRPQQAHRAFLEEMTRGQYWALCGAVALSVMAWLMARGAARATGTLPAWMQQPKKIIT